MVTSFHLAALKRARQIPYTIFLYLPDSLRKTIIAEKSAVSTSLCRTPYFGLNYEERR